MKVFQSQQVAATIGVIIKITRVLLLLLNLTNMPQFSSFVQIIDRVPVSDWDE